MDIDAARANMVENQIRANRVTDLRLIAALEELPREAFVPDPLRGIAYVDEDLPLGRGRYLMEPMVLARLVQAADIAPGDLVLDIGCATGYSSAVLAWLANTVVALESDPELAAAATRTLGELGIDTVAVVEGALEWGYPEQGPYDAILLNGAIPDVPDAIRRQLSDGGRLVTVVESGGIGRGVRVLRHGDHFARVELFDAATPALVGFAAPPAFVF